MPGNIWKDVGVAVTCGEIQGYKDIYSPVTLKCTPEVVLVTLHSYSTLIDMACIQLAICKMYR